MVRSFEIILLLENRERERERERASHIIIMSRFNAVADANTTDGTAPGAGVEIVATNATLTSSNSACAAVGSRLCIRDDVFETELSFNDEENYSSTQNQATKSEPMPTSFFGISRSGRNKTLGGTATCLFLLPLPLLALLRW